MRLFSTHDLIAYAAETPVLRARGVRLADGPDADNLAAWYTFAGDVVQHARRHAGPLIPEHSIELLACAHLRLRFIDLAADR